MIASRRRPLFMCVLSVFALCLFYVNVDNPRRLWKLANSGYKETNANTKPWNHRRFYAGFTTSTATSDSTVSKTSLSSSTSVVKVDKCDCQQVGWPGLFQTNMVFNERLSWHYNITEEEYLTRRHPNMPMALFRAAMNSTRCHLMPSVLNIEWMNDYWQMSKVSPNTTFLLYSAMYDNRPLTDLRPCIRLLGLSKAVDPKKGYCHLWFNVTGPPAVSQVERIEYVDWQGRSDKRYLPYLLMCRIPPSVAHLVPVAASLVEQPCLPATNILKVFGAMERNPATAFRNGKGPIDANGFKGWSHVVCGPALFYYHHDFSLRLVEWLEIYKALGFSKAILYVTDVHPNIEKVLRYYESEGFLDVIDFTHPSPYIDEETLRRLFVSAQRSELYGLQKVYFSDCILRYAHQYRFLAHFDPDEIPIISKHQNFSDYLDYLLATNDKNNTPSHYQWPYNYHYDDLGPGPTSTNQPQYFWYLRHNQRGKDHKNWHPTNIKSLYDLDTVTSALAHYAFLCASGPCAPPRNPSKEEAYTGHFNRICGDYCKEPGVLVEDNFLIRFADRIKSPVEEAVKKLHLLG